MLKRMCSTPPCSQPALSTVHHHPNSNTGRAPLAPSSTSAIPSGDRMDIGPPPPMMLPPNSTVMRRLRT
jgi:hypothetical protein